MGLGLYGDQFIDRLSLQGSEGQGDGEGPTCRALGGGGLGCHERCLAEEPLCKVLYNILNYYSSILVIMIINCYDEYFIGSHVE